MNPGDYRRYAPPLLLDCTKGPGYCNFLLRVSEQTSSPGLSKSWPHETCTQRHGKWSQLFAGNGNGWCVPVAAGPEWPQNPILHLVFQVTMKENHQRQKIRDKF
jgi:hypothetical protein